MGLVGEVLVPNDKSITHRSILFTPLANGTSTVKLNSVGRDNLASLRVMRQLGAKISGNLSKEVYELAQSEGVSSEMNCWAKEYSELKIVGSGLHSLKAPTEVLDCGNSGTTSRLLCGILAGQRFRATLTGDESLQSRPFKRVTDPLSQMGAHFNSDRLPLTITGAALKGINYNSPKASAQIKSAVLLAGLYADGEVVVTEPAVSRDHSELMLTAMGVDVRSKSNAENLWEVSLHPVKELKPLEIEVPGDFSAAGFFMVAASIIPNSEVLIKNVGFNSSRTGLYDILLRMGANIKPINSRIIGGELVVDLEVRAAALKATEVTAIDVIRAIDEIPILAVAAIFAEGTTVVTGASELRVKESDRIKMIVALLEDYEVNIIESEDGFSVEGYSQKTHKAKTRSWSTCGDHRILMSASVLSLALAGHLELSHKEVVETSFPKFSEKFTSLLGG